MTLADKSASLSWRVWKLSSGSMGHFLVAKIGPASILSVSLMMVMPVSMSPFSRAALMGEGPLYLGRREAWALMQGKWFVISAGSIMPKAITMIRSGFRVWTRVVSSALLAGVWTGSLFSWANALMGEGVGVLPRPRILSGFVMIVRFGFWLRRDLALGRANAGVAIRRIFFVFIPLL